MPFTNTQPALPFKGRSSRARQCSYEAAVSASETRQAKSAMYLTWLKSVEKATDHGAAEHFNWPLSSICSIRNGLVDRGLVTALGDCIGRYGKKVTLWTATGIHG